MSGRAGTSRVSRSLLLGVMVGLAGLAGCDAVREAASGVPGGGFRGVELSEPAPAPELRLTAADGSTFDLAAERGHVVLLFFGYTHCPDVCPTTLADWARVRAALSDDEASRARFVFVSVDPERDTPEASRAYARQFDSTFIGLTADQATIGRLRGRLNLVAQSEVADSGSAYAVAHSSQVFLIDQEGRLRLLYPFGSTATDMTEDIRRLLD
ncbi:MAG: SCO family protein [Gemmatimonadaceae bacterium]